MGVDIRTLNGKHGPCPLCGGKDRFRFDDKEGRGTYYCNGCGAGDGVQLAMALTGRPFAAVAQQIERLVGVVPPKAGKPERSDDDKRKALRAVHDRSNPIASDDEAARYLRNRGLALRDLPDSIHLHPRLAYYDEDGRRVAHYPAMLGIVRGANGIACSIHRTYLHDGRKAPVQHPKKGMAGLPAVGEAIRLAPVSECLGVAEGIETALSAHELFGVPTWSALSAAGIEAFVPPEGPRKIVIYGDNDESFAGQAAAYRAAQRLRHEGYEVDVRIPPSTGDWLDELIRRRRLH